MIANQPSPLWDFSITGSVNGPAAVSLVALKECSPSRRFQPKFGSAPADLSGARRRDVVDLLVEVLADVADDHRAGLAVEREPVGIAQAEHPHGARRRGKRIVGGNGVTAGRQRRDPQDLGQQRRPVVVGVRDGQVLTVALRVAAATAVAGAHVEHPVGPELELAAVVVLLDVVRDRQHAQARRQVGVVGRRGDHLVDLDIAGVVDRRRVARVIDIEAVAGRVVGRERHRQQPLLVARRVDERRHVQKRRRLLGAVKDLLDRPALLDDEHAVRVAGRRRDRHRPRERPDLLELGGRRARGGAERHGGAHHRGGDDAAPHRPAFAAVQVDLPGP